MLLVSPATYFAATLFVGFMGLIFSRVLDFFSIAARETSPTYEFFALFWLPVCVMVPLLTMKCLAEERRMGTIETLLTTPVTTAEVVLGKFAAAYFLYVALWASTGGLFYILYRFSAEARFFDVGPLVGGYVFIAVSGLFFVAIGVFASSLTRNQSVAAVLSCVILGSLIIGGNALGESTWLEQDMFAPVKSVLDYSHVLAHLNDFTRGIIDTRELLFYISGTVLMLIFSILGVEAKLLHS
jgi:ABC-2 type transport system permease protein